MQVVSKQRLEGKHGADGSAEKSLEKELSIKLGPLRYTQYVIVELIMKMIIN